MCGAVAHRMLFADVLWLALLALFVAEIVFLMVLDEVHRQREIRTRPAPGPAPDPQQSGDGYPSTATPLGFATPPDPRREPFARRDRHAQ
jgi:hypothetical protein